MTIGRPNLTLIPGGVSAAVAQVALGPTADAQVQGVQGLTKIAHDSRWAVYALAAAAAAYVAVIAARK